MILTFAILAFIAVAALALSLFRAEGDTVVVLLDGKQWGEYPLNEDRVIEVVVDDNYNIVVIEDGKAYVQRASCPDGICVSHPPVSRVGESIVCLPNKVVLTVQSDNDTDGLDSVIG